MASVRIIEREASDRLGEGPLWSVRENALYWVDILGQKLNRLRLDDGSLASWDMPEKIGWVIERSHRPGFVAGFASGFAFLELDLGCQGLPTCQFGGGGLRATGARSAT